MSLVHILISLIAGIAGGFVAGVTGGAGIISIPVLIFLGLPANAAIATNTLTGFGVTAAALPKYHRARQVRWRTGFQLAPLAIVGGLLGAKILIHVDANTLSVAVGWLLLLLIPVVLLNGDKGFKAFRPGLIRLATGVLLYFLIMLYSGLVGAGGGVFSLYALVYFFGMTYIEAKSTLSVTTIFVSAAAFIVFQLHGLVNFQLGIPLTIGMYIGGGLGAQTALKKGNVWVRTFFVFIAAVSAVKLLFFS